MNNELNDLELSLISQYQPHLNDAGKTNGFNYSIRFSPSPEVAIALLNRTINSYLNELVMKAERRRILIAEADKYSPREIEE